MNLKEKIIDIAKDILDEYQGDVISIDVRQYDDEISVGLHIHDVPIKHFQNIKYDINYLDNRYYLSGNIQKNGINYSLYSENYNTQEELLSDLQDTKPDIIQYDTTENPNIDDPEIDGIIF